MDDFSSEASKFGTTRITYTEENDEWFYIRLGTLKESLIKYAKANKGKNSLISNLVSSTTLWLTYVSTEYKNFVLSASTYEAFHLLIALVASCYLLFIVVITITNRKITPDSIVEELRQKCTKSLDAKFNYGLTTVTSLHQ